MAWCLIKEYADKFRKALKDGTIDPEKMSTMSSEERRSFLAEYVGEENAVNVNALFESKLLLKNQQAGMVTWAKRVAGITPETKRDLISRIERLTDVLDPAQEEQFLNDLVNTRLGIEVTQEEAKNIAAMSKAATEAKTKANEEGIFPSEEDRLDYGAKVWALKKYSMELKLKPKKVLSTKAEKVTDYIKDIPALAKSIRSSFDNSLWGRQGIKVLSNPKTTRIWAKNFMDSWKNIGKELRGVDAMDAIQADIMSRPNAINGKYKAGGFGLDIFSEEAFPVSPQEKIPVLKRIFAASESAYNGGALSMRADLADWYIRKAEEQGVNMRVPEEAKPIGRLVSSLTGRGSLGRVAPLSGTLNVYFFSVRFAKSNFDTVFAPLKYIKDIGGAKVGITKPKTQAEQFATKQAAEATARIVATQAAILLIAKMIDPDSVDEDPRSTNFGKIKIYGRWTDITGGMSAVARLAARLTPTIHDGEWGLWRKSKAGNWENLWGEGFGKDDGADLLLDFVSGKLSPAARTLLYDTWLKGGKDFYGEPISLVDYLENLAVPLPVENAIDILRDPNGDGVLFGILMDALGFSTSTDIEPNTTSKLFETDKIIKAEDFMSTMEVYARAYGTDPVTAAQRMFSGQRIVQISPNNIIVVERNDEWGERKKEYAEKYGVNEDDIKEVREEHIIPIAAGGEEAPSNREMISVYLWREFTKVDQAYIKARKEKRISKGEGDKLISDYKRSRINGSTDITQEEVLERLSK